METIQIAKQIQQKINVIVKMRSELRKRSEKKSIAISNYEKNIAITMIKLRNGVEFELDGEKIADPPVTLIEKIARGICYKEKLELEESESLYKSLIVNINAVESELNGLQSINKYLDKL